jgi:2,5-dichloro-2,5-cyclohexadiene-1,4-diol dehydrogenase 1
MAELKDRCYIVTGAGSGIGCAAAQILARKGASIVVADISEKTGRETVELIQAEGGSASFIYCDVSKEDDARETVNFALKTYGKLDGAFNNAGLPPVGVPLHELTSAQFQRSLEVNIQGVFHLMKYEIQAMLDSGKGGSIVNTASTGGVVAIPLHVEYVASKHAVVGLSRAAATDYGTHGIRVNALLPGAVGTPMLKSVIANDPEHQERLNKAHPIGRYGEPEEIGETASWLLSDASSFITGAAIAADGGYTAI